jgi:hypothetical protein
LISKQTKRKGMTCFRFDIESEQNI